MLDFRFSSSIFRLDLIQFCYVSFLDSQESTTTRQDSGDSSDLTPLVIVPPLQQRPTIVIDSSQLPLHREHNLKVRKADSKGSLHMQSETMC